MSRSYRRQPSPEHHESEKWEKRTAHRRLRLACRRAILRGAETFPILREVSNLWGWSKDGKWYMVPPDPEDPNGWYYWVK